MPSRTIPLLMLLTLSVAASQTSTSTTPEQTNSPLIVTQSNEVLVDVTVSGRDGNAVPGLREEDFAVTEDGKPQMIDFFEAHTGATRTPMSPARLPSYVFSNQTSFAPGDTVNVLLIDRLNTTASDQALLRRQIEDAVGSMKPGTPVAIYSLESRLRLVNGFTADAPALKAALGEIPVTSIASAAVRSRNDELRDKEDVAQMSSPQAAEAMARSLHQYGANVDQQRISGTLTGLEQLGRALAAFPGRKNVFWFASSFPLTLFPGDNDQMFRNGRTIPEEFRRAADLLTESRIALYPVPAQGILADSTMNAESGLRSTGDDPAQAGRQNDTTRNGDFAAMNLLATETGGEAVTASNDLRAAISGVLEKSARYYTLAYPPSNNRLDGGFRRIGVKISSGKYALSCRRGYFATNGALLSPDADPLSPLLGANEPAATEVVYSIRVAPVSPQPATDAARLGGNPNTGKMVTRYRASFEVPAAGLRFATPPDGTREASVEVALIARDADGKAVNWTASRMNLRLNAESYQGALSSGVPLHLEMDIPRSAAVIESGIYDLAADRAGTIEVPMSAAEAAPPFSQPEPAASATPMTVEPPPDPAGVAAGSEPATTGPNEPTLQHRPAETAKPVVKPDRMQLDLVVTDATGQPVKGLQPWDLTLLDNDRPSKIKYFRAFDGVSAKADPPVEVILVLDLLNTSPQQAAFARYELNRCLHQNGGRLDHPVTLMVLTDAGLSVQPRPTRDGLALAELLKTVGPRISTINAAMGLQGSIERFNRSVQQVRLIAENETHKPGRKLLVWIGTGWPMLETQNFVPAENDRRKYFQTIVDLTNWLRQARIAVYCVTPVDSGSTRALFYQNFLKPVLEPHLAQSGSLAVRVLAKQTGGKVLGPDNDLAGQIRQCEADADNFYQLTFEAPAAQKADEYHQLKVNVNRPGVTVRTNTGYYDEPASR